MIEQAASKTIADAATSILRNCWISFKRRQISGNPVARLFHLGHTTLTPLTNMQKCFSTPRRPGRAFPRTPCPPFNRLGVQSRLPAALVILFILMACAAAVYAQEDGTFKVSESWKVSVYSPYPNPDKPQKFTRTGTETGTITVTDGGYDLINKTGVAKVGSLAASIDTDYDPTTINGQPVLYAFAAKGSEFYVIVKLNFFVVAVPLGTEFGYTFFQNDYPYTGTFTTATEVEGYGSATDENGAEYDASSLAKLTVTTSDVSAPHITTQPRSQGVAAGGSVAFDVTATGTAPLSYQWKHSGIALSDSSNVYGSATSSLTVDDAGSGDAGKYTVVVSNEKGSVTSAAATLTLETPPSIVTQPVDKDEVAGHAAVFTVKASGSTPLAYRWYFNGERLSNGHGVSGATSARLVIDASASLEGYYSVAVTNGVGSVESGYAYLSVQSPPSIVSRPVSQTLGAGTNASFYVDATGTGPLTYQWKRGSVDLTNGANYQGTATATLIIPNVQTAEAGAYEVVILNAVGSVTSPRATLTVDQPPTITSQPTNQPVAAGATAAFAVKAAGTGPLHYQWRFNGNNLANSASLSGATTPKLTLRKVQAAAAGTYTVLITNRVGQIVSTTNAVLTVSSAAPTGLALQMDAGATSSMSLVTISFQPVFTSAQILPGGGFQFTISGGSAQALIIQSSTTLQPGSWVNVSTNAVVNGQVIFTDANAGQAEARFYRAVSQ
jgi:hypothetical protein